MLYTRPRPPAEGVWRGPRDPLCCDPHVEHRPHREDLRPLHAERASCRAAADLPRPPRPPSPRPL